MAAFSRYNSEYSKKQRQKIRHNQCKYFGCFNFVWKDGYCYRHQYMIDAKKPIPKMKKRKVSRTDQYGFKSQIEMFQFVIYNAPRPIICPVSGKDITKIFDQETEVWICACAHILPKGRFPLWKHNPRNLVLVDPEVHRLFDQGTETQRQQHTDWDWQYLYDLRDKLKIEYEKERNEGKYHPENDTSEDGA